MHTQCPSDCFDAAAAADPQIYGDVVASVASEFCRAPRRNTGAWRGDGRMKVMD